ncbi:hypothetical protein Vretimale_8854 [Volvox reticuliferus]|uniref:Uncharacterized protein n=1 Tax=Volvox reticuliferus TaxID=1737510 RepID=A0A8J4FL48_9CHLO|nr:hypothetical protein Vretifemale_6137 [Volvox reticuliferus]GIM04274.1 hypothetical protein Vretimale_8854 [Volvox reticuliferus]
MEPARARSPVALSQRLQDIAERLSTLAKAELYQVLEGIAPTGEFSSLHRLDPLVNDIVFQISDSFKQAVVKRLLPEASKLLGSRSAALAAAPPWAGAQAPQSPGPTSLVSNVKQHPHLENDILALGLAPGTGQPLRPDQGPPQDAVSAAASSLLQGATAVAVPSPKQRHQSNLSPPPYTTSGSGGGGGGGGGCSSVNSGTSASALHPPESRFAFANVSGDIRRRTTPLSPPLGRDGSYGGNAAGNAAAIADLVSSADPLLLLGLGESGASLGFDAGGTGGDGATTNGLAVSVDSFLLGSSLAGSIGSAVGSGAGGGATPGAGGSAGGSGGVFTPVTSPSPNALGRHLGALSLATGTPGGSSGGGAASASAASAGRIVSSSISSPSPNPSTPSPYSSLPLTIRPGSSLDPGLATPPVSLAGTEPLRSTPQALPTPQQQHPQQLDRLSTGGDMSPLTPLVPSGSAAAAAATPPVPLFGGAPGPSPGGSSQQQLLRQHQVQQQHLQHQYMGVGAAGLVREVGGMAPNGNTTNGNAAAFHHQQQQQHVQAQYNLQQLQQQDMGEYPRQQYNLTQQQQQQQQLSALHYDGSGFASVSTVRAALAAAPDGPRASYDGRSPSGGYVVQNMQVPYDIQMMYGGSGVGALDLQQAGALGDRYSSPSGQGAAATAVRGSFASGGAASPDYGVYSLTPLAGGGGMGGAMVVDLIRSGSSGGSNAAAVTTMGILPPAGGAGAGGFGVGSGVGRSAGSPAMVLAASGAPGTAAGRPSRSGATSAGSVVDSCSSSFSTGPMGPQAAAPRRGSGNGGSTATVLPFIVQQSSPPASDASGPSSAASVSTAGVAAGGAGGLAAVKGGGAAASVVSADGSSSLSMAAKLQQAASKPAPSPTGGGSGRGGKGGAGPKAPADMPGRFRCLPPAVQARIHALTRDNHVVLLKDFDEKVLSKMTLLVDKFGAAECLAMLDRIEEVLKGKAGRLANGPGYLDVSVSTRLDELKQRASGQVTAPEDYARSTLHSRIYAELRDLITRHGFLQWHHFDQGIINMLKKMPNATALERLNELAYHSFKNVDNPKSCIVSIFTTKPKYVTS